jgi:hypothetical protein
MAAITSLIMCAPFVPADQTECLSAFRLGFTYWYQSRFGRGSSRLASAASKNA